MRRSSLCSLDVGIDREIDSQYDDIKAVANSIDDVTTVAGLDLIQLSTDIDEAMDFSDITVETGAVGSDASWDDDTKTLTIPRGNVGETGSDGSDGLKGDTGDTGSIGIRGEKGNTGLTGATGLTGSTGSTGESGDTGAKGDTGDSLTLTSIVNNSNETMTFHFSDGTSHTTANLKGSIGPRGPIGVSVESIRQLSNMGYGKSNTHVVSLSDGSEEYMTFENGDSIESIVSTYADGAEEVGIVATMFGGTELEFTVPVITGATGEQGNRGYQGIQGIQGIQGEIGEQGLAGSAGAAGVDGMTPQYEFVYNEDTGDLEYNLTGYIASTDAPEGEW